MVAKRFKRFYVVFEKRVRDRVKVPILSIN